MTQQNDSKDARYQKMQFFLSPEEAAAAPPRGNIVSFLSKHAIHLYLYINLSLPAKGTITSPFLYSQIHCTAAAQFGAFKRLQQFVVVA